MSKAAYEDRVRKRMQIISEIQDDSFGPRPDPEIIQAVTAWLIHDAQWVLRRPYIYPTRDGGVSVEWDTSEGAIDLCMEPCGDGAPLIIGVGPRGDLSEGSTLEEALVWLREQAQAAETQRSFP
jgi:hypothetical protein